MKAADGLSDPFQRGQSGVLQHGVPTVESGGCGLVTMRMQAGSDQGREPTCVGRLVGHSILGA